MLTIFIRTVIIYVLLVITMRLMGKRQLGELELSELVITFLLSEIASLPITNSEIPIMYAIIPILTLMSLEIITSILMINCPPVKKILSSRPAVIISKGVISRSEMKNARISLDELISQIRQNGIYNLEDVDYAIIEENGKMSIVPKSSSRPPDIKTLGLADFDSGVMHILISDGKTNSYNLNMLGKDLNWLKSKLEKHGIKISEVFCMTVNDAGKIFIQKKDGTQIKPSSSV